jgi:death-on-curing protein
MSRWYPSLEDVLALHADQITRYGGAPGIRDLGLVEMGLYRPQTGYYKDVLEEASALWESFMQNHPFIDGNKRTAFAIMHTFLLVNGFGIRNNPKNTIDFIYGLFERHEVNFKQLDAWLRDHVAAL